MSYDSQRGGVSGAPDPFAVPEVQLDCDGTGGNSSLPGGQGHDKPLMQVGTYGQPAGSVNIAGIMASDNDPLVDKPAPGTKGGHLPIPPFGG